MYKPSSSYVTTVLFLIYLYSLASSIQVSSLDTLRQGDVLNSTSRLTSARNTFTLGFYTADDTNNSYVAIWYTIDLSSPVWIGNREDPVFSNSGAVLTISRNGSLLITRQGNGDDDDDPIELYSGHESSRNVSATLLDSGNFVVKEVSSSNGSGVVILWQSFDHPFDTLLAGMKLGTNHRTGRNWTLRSWFSPSDPAPGPYAMEWDGRGLVVRRRGVVYWTSGELVDYYLSQGNMRVKAFENIQDPDPAYLNYNFTSYSSEDEDYFMYSLIVDPILTPDNQRVISGMWVSYMGDLNQNFGPVIANISLCYGYRTQGGSDVSLNGCELREEPRCRNRRETFIGRVGNFRRSNGDIASVVNDDNSSLSLSDCREQCWNDCECAGFADSESGCGYWRGGNLRFEDDTDGTATYVLNSPSPDRRVIRLIRIILPVVIPTLLFLLVAALFLRRRIKQSTLLVIYRLSGSIYIFPYLSLPLYCINDLDDMLGRREEKMHELLTLEGYSEGYEQENGGGNAHDLRLFTYASVIAATNNFSSDHKLGEGGFGPVYKGKTSEGQEIAVKLLSRKSGQGLLEFKTELILISKLQHVNLVKLIGFCIHGDDKMIVYEYMPNKSLDFYLFDSSKKEELDWSRRLNIIDGIAQGLLYLHKYSRLRIVHRDLKSGNILLDKNLNPKISDFGLARIFKQDASEANTTRRVGTYGYMAPEYAMQGIFSYKSDVYSYGVLVLEIVSGRKNSSFHNIEGPLNLVEYAWELWNNNSALKLMDPTLRSSCIIDQVQRCINIGLLCVENHAVDRPDIEEVISMLRNETSSLPLLKNPAFTKRNSMVEVLEESSSQKLSTVELTNSEIGGR